MSVLTIDKRGRLRVPEAAVQRGCIELLRASGWIVRPAPREGHKAARGALVEAVRIIRAWCDMRRNHHGTVSDSLMREAWRIYYNGAPALAKIRELLGPDPT